MNHVLCILNVHKLLFFCVGCVICLCHIFYVRIGHLLEVMYILKKKYDKKSTSTNDDTNGHDVTK